jgi:hypothetical protein
MEASITMKKYRWCALLWLVALIVPVEAAESPSIQVSPAAVTLRAGQKKTFTVTTHGSVKKPLAWRVISTSPGSKGALGAVMSDGVYTAPSDLPTPNTVLVQAQDPSNALVFGNASVTLLNPLPSISSVSPAAINTGLPYTVSVKGSGFLPASLVQWNGQTVSSIFVSSTEIDLTGTSTLAAGTKDSAACRMRFSQMR